MADFNFSNSALQVAELFNTTPLLLISGKKILGIFPWVVRLKMRLHLRVCFRHNNEKSDFFNDKRRTNLVKFNSAYEMLNTKKSAKMLITVKLSSKIKIFECFSTSTHERETSCVVNFAVKPELK